jgi:hypothetical protein
VEVNNYKLTETFMRDENWFKFNIENPNTRLEFVNLSIARAQMIRDMQAYNESQGSPNPEYRKSFKHGLKLAIKFLNSLGIYGQRTIPNRQEEFIDLCKRAFSVDLQLDKNAPVQDAIIINRDLFVMYLTDYSDKLKYFIDNPEEYITSPYDKDLEDGADTALKDSMAYSAVLIEDNLVPIDKLQTEINYVEQMIQMISDAPSKLKEV